MSAEQVKPGYKRTEVGVIPEEWEVDSIANLALISTGDKNTQDRIDDGAYPFFVRSQTVERINTYTFDGEAVLTAGDGVGTGKIFHYIKGKFDLHQRVYKISDFNNLLDGSYFYRYFSSNFYSRIMQMTAKSSVDSVRREMIADMRVPLPKISEQRAIAAALSDVDALLAQLDQLIDKKRDLKQAAMQQLLTGQTRLPGFSGEWSRIELHRLVSTPITDGPHMTPKFFDSGVPFLSVNNLVNNRIDLTDLRFISKSDDEIFSKKCKPKKGDVLMGKAASVGKVAIVESELDFNIWSPIALIRPNQNLNSKFLYYQLLSTDSITQITLLTNSSSQGNIGMGDIEKIQISHPCIDEQIAIASILSGMDAELATLEARRDKTRALKQGMMQELLTGRLRLI